MIISYDFGHCVPYDGGASGFLYEETVVKEYGQMVIDKLRKLGHTCINCTPSTASSLKDSLSKRTNMANACKSELHLCFHANSASEGARGCEILYVSSKGKEYAQKICNEIATIGFQNRGPKYRDDLWMLNNTIAVCILFEPFFVSNKEDCNLYTLNKEALANAIVKAMTGTTPPNTGNSNSNRPTNSYSPSLKELQHEFNVQGFRDSKGNTLWEDGIYGWRTQSAADKCYVRQGARGNITKWIQKKLISLGYSVGNYGADGVFGPSTLSAVKSFQKNKGLGVDGIVGSNTWKALMNS